jgi:hypothetical protein
MTQRMEREGSLTFSLAELSRLEDQRLRSERERQAGLVKAEALAAEEAARKKQEREAEDVRIREDARRSREREAREDEARQSARREAEALRAKALAEGETQARLALSAQQHEEALARIAAQGGGRTWRRLALASCAGSAAVIAIALVVELLVLRPEAKRHLAAAEGDAIAKSEEVRQARESVEQERSVEEALRVALDERTRASAALGKSLDSALAEIEHLKAPHGSGPPRSRNPTEAPHPGPFSNDCPPGSRDPLCGLGPAR